MRLRITSRGAAGVTAATALAAALQLTSGLPVQAQTNPATPKVTDAGKCIGDNVGITLPQGFCATIFADKIGHARQMVVAPDGTLYVNTWSGAYYKGPDIHPGGFLVALKDTDGSGTANKDVRFGPTADEGNHGGTGIGIHDGYLYAETNHDIVRYKLEPGKLAPSGQPEVIVTGLPTTGDHPMHPFIIDAKGNLFVDLGTATNACEIENRQLHSKGNEPCTEKETRGGIWRFDATKQGQRFSPAERYATGLRNGEGFSTDAAGQIFVTQHGRDQLHVDWPDLYTAQQGHELPAEEIVALKKGADYGWPECYYDGFQQKLMLAPEYGGDGKKVGVCAEKQGPAAFFPAHYAPNDMKFYEGKQFPKAYDDGAFVAFHGSWNRAPAPQRGYNVVFQPFKNGTADGKWVVFADGFAGPHMEPSRALHRPSGLAIGPKGALYVSDDVGGRIWRITYVGGNPNAPVEGAPVPADERQASASPNALPPEGMHPNAGRLAAGLPTPPGATAQDVALGDRIFHGEVDHGTCGGCHGGDLSGTPIGANLMDGKWIWSDGSLQGITQTIANGVPNPQAHPEPMPPMGGMTMSRADLKAVASYVWAVSHPGGH